MGHLWRMRRTLGLFEEDSSKRPPRTENRFAHLPLQMLLAIQGHPSATKQVICCRFLGLAFPYLSS